ncbi:hypothetical protein [Fontivita pretiosa]|uniref:hypothetical protein n=1 Tax=Fontivita pretiosa TaxID=2989684 RepID=UPI003D17C03B
MAKRRRPVIVSAALAALGAAGILCASPQAATAQQPQSQDQPLKTYGAVEPEAIGRVTANFGNATASGAAGTRNLDLQDLIRNDEKIVTSDGGLTVLLASRVVLKIDRNTAVSVFEDADQTTIGLEYGTVHVYVGQRPAQSGVVCVADPNGRIEALKGVFLASFDPGLRKSYYACEHTAATVLPAQADQPGQKLTLAGDSQVLLEGGRVISSGELDRAAFNQHKQWLDRLGQAQVSRSAQIFRLRSRAFDTQSAIAQLSAAGWIDRSRLPGAAVSAKGKSSQSSSDSDTQASDRNTDSSGAANDSRGSGGQVASAGDSSNQPASADDASGKTQRIDDTARPATPEQTAPPPVLLDPVVSAQPSEPSAIQIDLGDSGPGRSQQHRGNREHRPGGGEQVGTKESAKESFKLDASPKVNARGENPRRQAQAKIDLPGDLPSVSEPSLPKIDLDLRGGTKKGGGKDAGLTLADSVPSVPEVAPPKVEIDLPKARDVVTPEARIDLHQIKPGKSDRKDAASAEGKLDLPAVEQSLPTPSIEIAPPKLDLGLNEVNSTTGGEAPAPQPELTLPGESVPAVIDVDAARDLSVQIGTPAGQDAAEAATDTGKTDDAPAAQPPEVELKGPSDGAESALPSPEQVGVQIESPSAPASEITRPADPDRKARKLRRLERLQRLERMRQQREQIAPAPQP